MCGSFKCIGTSSEKSSMAYYQPGGVGMSARKKKVGRRNKAVADESEIERWDIKYAKNTKQGWKRPLVNRREY
eukprot:2823431-Ditylum_brightwellii.AAC.1